ncbi:hypothetical protein JXB41_07325 [Candidatus Woesearchaeota archaeon]|nr:hypothetical protein [Candidatus Woesearchaeota archaeon]
MNRKKKKRIKFLFILIAVNILLVSVFVYVYLNKTNKKIFTGDTDKLRIVDYSVRTRWLDQEEYVYADGFINNYPRNSDEVSYIVNGSIENIAGKDIERFKFSINFRYNENPGEYTSLSTIINDLADKETKEFTGTLNREDSPVFNKIYFVTFDTSISDLNIFPEEE